MKDYPKLIKKAIRDYEKKHFDPDMLVWELKAIINEEED